MSEENNTYAVIDNNNIARNFILWDGVSPYDPGEGFRLVKINSGISYDYNWIYDENTQNFIDPVN